MPVLLVTGANDENVPVASERLADALLLNSELFEWPLAYHVFNTPSGNERPAVLRRVSEFLLE